MQEMFDTALMLANQPPPPGRRIAILTNAGGGAPSRCPVRAAGLVLASELAEETVRCWPTSAVRRQSGRPTPEGDGTTTGSPLGALLGDRGVDAVIVLFIPPLVERSAPIAQEAIVDAATSVPNKPVLASPPQEGVVESCASPVAVRSVLSIPRAAATALGHAVAYNNWLRMPGGIIRTPKGVSRRRGAHPGARLRAGRVGRRPRQRWLLATFGIVADLRDADATPDDGGRGEDQHGEVRTSPARRRRPIFGSGAGLGFGQYVRGSSTATSSTGSRHSPTATPG